MLTVVLAAAFSAPVDAWGRDGHEIVAGIANFSLSASSRRVSLSVLNGKSLSDVANWADDIASDIPWSYGLHFINVMQSPCENDGDCMFVYSRDCVDDLCVAGAILNYTDSLSTSLKENKTEYSLIAENSLRFIVHYMGDIHQPLHSARDYDRGGNNIDVVFYVPGQGSDWNLHNVWDFGLIVRTINESFAGSKNAFTVSLLQQLENDYSPSDIIEWTQCISLLPKGDISGLKSCVEEWAQESLSLALSDSYLDEHGIKIVSGDEISDAYWQARIKPVQERLIMSGVRLAAIIEFAYN